jgi:hypothetical protein
MITLYIDRESTVTIQRGVEVKEGAEFVIANVAVEEHMIES